MLTFISVNVPPYLVSTTKDSEKSVIVTFWCELQTLYFTNNCHFSSKYLMLVYSLTSDIAVEKVDFLTTCPDRKV